MLVEEEKKIIPKSSLGAPMLVEEEKKIIPKAP